MRLGLFADRARASISEHGVNRANEHDLTLALDLTFADRGGRVRTLLRTKVCEALLRAHCSAADGSAAPNRATRAVGDGESCELGKGAFFGCNRGTTCVQPRTRPARRPHEHFADALSRTRARRWLSVSGGQDHNRSTIPHRRGVSLRCRPEMAPSSAAISSSSRRRDACARRSGYAVGPACRAPW
jgi:hypothetical protein